MTRRFSLLTAALLAVTLGAPGSASAGTVPSAAPGGTAPLAVDVDGDGYAADDCSPLNPAVHPGARDLPDLAFVDADCDGIDGTASKAVFVSLAGDDAAPGTRANPKRTIGAAIAAAAAAGSDVYVAGGTYATEAAGGVPLADGVGVYGGYAPVGWARSANEVTAIEGAPAVLAAGDRGVVLQRLTLRGKPDRDGNSYGLRAIAEGGTPSEVALDGVTIVAGGAGPAEHGASGRDGIAEAGLPGGVGGIVANCVAELVLGQAPGPAGTPGKPGSPGANAGFALQEAAEWGRGLAATGTAGGPGGGGAGGAGGESKSILSSLGLPTLLCGGAGGAGGPGGGGGLGGRGGRDGAGSFGAYLLDSSLVAIGSTLGSGDGGAGGNGGIGGQGGSGGPGLAGVLGDCQLTICAAAGAAGALGLPGGPGGGGGAGVGGPSAAVYQAGADSAYVALRTVEAAGDGGPGGMPGILGGAPAAAGESAKVLRTLTAPLGSAYDFDADQVLDGVDACPTIPRSLTDLNADGCPEPPDTAITGGPRQNGFVTSTAASFVLGSDQAGSTFTCSLDGGAGGDCTSPYQLSTLAAKTHTVSVWARGPGRDLIGNPVGEADPTAATRTWTVPRDDTTLKRSSGWRQVRSAGYYLKSYSTAKRRGAVLSTKVAGARRLALVASVGPGFGKVTVLLGSKKLRTIDLSASRLRKRQVLPVKSFRSGANGKLRIVVASSGKPVRIEGLGVATR